MPALTAYANTMNTALNVLADKGYQLWHRGDMYWAEKDGWDFAADDPNALLGVVGIFEHVGPASYREYWWRRDDPARFGKLPEKPREYVSVIKGGR